LAGSGAAKTTLRRSGGERLQQRRGLSARTDPPQRPAQPFLRS